MMKKIILLLFFFAFALIVKAQDSLNPAKTYANDSTGFTAYPEVFLLENLKLPEKYTKLEINTWVTPYVPGKRDQHQYKNLYRYPADVQKLPDTVVLSKCDLLKCFTACWCPDVFPWYISAQAPDHQIITVTDTSLLKTFLGNTGDKFNACLWLSVHDQKLDIPVKTFRDFKYKKVKDGYLIRYTARINNPVNSNVAYADMTYLISDDFKIFLVNKKHIVITNYKF